MKAQRGSPKPLGSNHIRKRCAMSVPAAPATPRGLASQHDRRCLITTSEICQPRSRRASNPTSKSSTTSQVDFAVSPQHETRIEFLELNLKGREQYSASWYRFALLFPQRRIPARLCRRNGSQTALLISALRTPQPLLHVRQLRIPAAQTPQHMRFGGTFMSAGRACQDQSVLPELIAQFIDSDFARHAADCYEPKSQRPPSA